MDIGDRIKIFPETDTKAYIRYFESIGFKSAVVKNYILITGYYSGIRKNRLKKKEYSPQREIGKRIRGIRQKMYFTVEELAEEINTTPLVIESWENGKEEPTGSEFDRFLEFSGATREYVIDGKGKWVDEVKQILKEMERD